MSWLKLILQVLAGFFGWRKNESDPRRDFEKRHDEWAKQLRRLEDATKLAVRDREAYIVICPADEWNDDKFEQLCELAVQAATREHSHRAREPQCGTY